MTRHTPAARDFVLKQKKTLQTTAATTTTSAYSNFFFVKTGKSCKQLADDATVDAVVVAGYLSEHTEYST